MNTTGIVRDDLFIDHDPGEWHPESPLRLKAIHKLLDSREWPGVTTLERRQASREEICLVHTPRHFDQIARTDGQNGVALDPDTHVSAKSFQAALYAAGGLIHLTEQVVDNKLANGFALVRPPGHHAEPSRAMGFCLFNNVAVAAAWAIKYKDLSRVMIIDWDLHHGNGTQHSFYSDRRVLYLSTHQYPFYPGSGALDETGVGNGQGFTVNIPLGWGHGDKEYVAIFKNIAIPLARAYQPELILVSAGFDIYKGDPLGGMQVTTDGFAALTRILKTMAEELCQGRLVLTLEGGYHVQAQAEGVGKVIDVLANNGTAGRELALTRPPEPPIVEKVREYQARFWDI